MTERHWLMLLATGAFFAALALISFFIRPGERKGKAFLRSVAAALALHVSAALGGVGLNAVSLLTVTLLGAPGYLLLWAIGRL